MDARYRHLQRRRNPNNRAGQKPNQPKNEEERNNAPREGRGNRFGRCEPVAAHRKDLQQRCLRRDETNLFIEFRQCVPPDIEVEATLRRFQRFQGRERREETHQCI